MRITEQTATDVIDQVREAAIAGLLHECFNGVHGGRTFFKQMPVARILAWEGAALVGHVGLEYRLVRTGEILFPIVSIIDLCVAPRARGRGIGATLLNHAEYGAKGQAEAEARESARRRVIDARDQTLRDAIEARTAWTATPKTIGSSQSQPKAPSGGLRNQAGAVTTTDAGRPADADPIKGGPRKPEDLPFDPSYRDPRRDRDRGR